jgi:hypothetical protein
VIIDGDQNNDGREVTLSGGHYGSAETVEGGNRVFNIVGGETDADLRDLTLADGFSNRVNGGAVLLGGGGLVLTGCTIRDSSPGEFFDGAGGGIYAAAGSRLAILSSTIVDCWRIHERGATG